MDDKTQQGVETINHKNASNVKQVNKKRTIF